MSAESPEWEIATELDQSIAPVIEGFEEETSVPQFAITVVAGPDSGKAWTSSQDRCRVGSNSANDLVLTDPTVSRFHCEIVSDATGVRVRDLDSKNGVWVDGLRVVDAWLRHGSVTRLGQTSVRLDLHRSSNTYVVSESRAFGHLVGQSVRMRAVFHVLERAATSDITVLLEGETGTGKTAAAEALHQSGARSEGPFVVVDCGTVSRNLIESELFGHERGAFTGSVSSRSGAFERASGGTLFLDEVGELPPELQKTLLRVLEARSIRRVGGNHEISVDVRVIAATNRDLRTEVNAGTFREDLYYRLAVLHVTMPPLRSRPTDIPMVAVQILQRLGVKEAIAILTPDVIQRIAKGSWPGNARQLRNYLERQILLGTASLTVDVEQASSDEAPPINVRLSFAASRRHWVDAFERRYLQALLQSTRDNLSEAARRADLARSHLYRLLDKHALRP